MSDAEALIHVMGLMQKAQEDGSGEMNISFKEKEMVLTMKDEESKLRFISSMEKPKVTRDGSDGIITASKIIAEVGDDEYELEPDDEIIEVKITGMGDLMDNDMWYTEE